MRLNKVATGHGWIDKLRFAWRELHTGRGVTDIQRALFYRADFFGTAFGRYWREAQYDSPSQLSIGERQVLAAIISQSNRCLFCTVGHAEAASRYVPVDTVDSMLRGDDAVMGPRMRALAVFARKLTVTPGDVGPDGSIYVLTRKASLIPAHHPSDPVLEDFVTRFSADGTELETVSIRDCLARSEFASELDAIRVGGDVFHTNSVQLLDDRGAALGPAGAAAFPEGGVLVSVRQLDLLAALDLERRTVTWARRGSWRRQHEPTLLPGGTMLVFDNLSVPRRSGVLEFDPLTGEQLWLYRAAVDDAFFTSGAGTCQRLANGNTLICASNAGRAFEVSPQREVVWEWKTPHRVEGPDGEALAATLFDLHRLDAAFPLDWLR